MLPEKACGVAMLDIACPTWYRSVTVDESGAKRNLPRAQWFATLGAVVVLAICLGMWPHVARADWHSLTGTLPAHVGRVDYIISPDSRTVAFVADIDEDD